jgi:hypothetical protein
MYWDAIYDTRSKYIIVHKFTFPSISNSALYNAFHFMFQAYLCMHST